MTTIRLLKNGVQAFPAMFGAIDNAGASIALEMYIIADDETGRQMRERLIAAAKRGVQVEVLIDAWGSWNLPGSFWNELTAAGGVVRWFHPIARGIFFFRNHRKLLLIDDAIAFIGGMNVADEYFRGAKGEPSWRDNVIEISAVEVGWLRLSFSRMWARAGSSLHRILLRFYGHRTMMTVSGGGVRFLESGPEHSMRPVRKIYREVIQQARTSIDLSMGYFYPHGSTLRALKRAARRGVRVRLLFSHRTDVPVARWAARGLYGRLLRAGIEVWEYLPSMLHAKLAIADDIVIAGSANLDIRSGRINYELVAIVTDAALASRARSDFEMDINTSVRIHYDEWKKRSFIEKLKEQISYCLLARADIYIARLEIAGRIRRSGFLRHP